MTHDRLCITTANMYVHSRAMLCWTEGSSPLITLARFAYDFSSSRSRRSQTFLDLSNLHRTSPISILHEKSDDNDRSPAPAYAMESREGVGETSGGEIPKLELPSSCDPPMPGAATQQLVWIVRLTSCYCLPAGLPKPCSHEVAELTV